MLTTSSFDVMFEYESNDLRLITKLLSCGQRLNTTKLTADTYLGMY